MRSRRRAWAEESAREGMPNQVLQRSARSESRRGEPVRLARPLTTSLDRGGVIEMKRSGADAESKKRPGWRSWLKRTKPNQVLQRSARSEVLHLEPVRHARPLNTSLDPREVIEVKLSAIGGESKKRQMWSSPLKQAKSNQGLQRSARSEVLQLP
jgi:hypothetical protein